MEVTTTTNWEEEFECEYQNIAIECGLNTFEDLKKFIKAIEQEALKRGREEERTRIIKGVEYVIKDLEQLAHISDDIKDEWHFIPLAKIEALDQVISLIKK